MTRQHLPQNPAEAERLERIALKLDIDPRIIFKSGQSVEGCMCHFLEAITDRLSGTSPGKAGGRGGGKKGSK